MNNSMDMPKPLIFVNPLSPSLEKLREVINETSQEDGIEIYECEDLNEANQLIQTVGASITLISHPKLCSTLLQINRRAIKRLKSKVLLLSPKDLPRNTIQKFQKIGLTEFLCEPVVPKSLVYKVKFLIKSLPAMKMEEEKEEKNIQKVESLIHDKEEKDESETTQVKSLLLTEDINENDSNKGTQQTDLQLSPSSTDDNTASSDGNLLFDLDEASKDSEKKGNLDIEPSTSDLKKGNFNLDIESGSSEDNLDPNLDLDIENQGISNKKGNSLNFDEDGPKVLESSKGLNLEESSQTGEPSNELGLNIEESDSGIGSQSKGFSLDDTQDISSLDKELDNFIDEAELEDPDEPLENNEFGNENLQSEKSLDIEDSDNSLDNNFSNDLGIVDSHLNPQANEDFESENENSLLSSDQDDFNLEDSSENPEESTKELSIDGQDSQSLKGLEEEDEISKLKDSEGINLAEGGAQESLSDKDDLDLESGSTTDGDTDNLDLNPNSDQMNQQSMQDENELGAYETLDSENSSLKIDDQEATSDSDLNIEDDEKKLDSSEELDGLIDESQNKDDISSELDLESENSLENKNIEVNIESGERIVDKNVEIEVDEKKDEYYNNASSFNFNEKKEKERKEIEADWEGLVTKKDNTYDNFSSNKKDGEQTISLNRRDAGEQTIDYGKIHKEFTEGKYEEKVEEEDSNREDKKNKKEEDEDSDKPVIPPDSKGLEYIINLLKLYEDPEVNEEQILDYISKVTDSETNGHLIFFIYDNRKGDFFEIFNSFVEKENPDPVRSELWSEIRRDNIKTWKETQLPTWKDPKFLTPENIFYYPYFDGQNRLGFTIGIFNNGVDESNSKKVEVFMESARGIFLDFSSNEDFLEKTRIENAGTIRKVVEKVKGFFKSLFG